MQGNICRITGVLFCLYLGNRNFTFVSQDSHAAEGVFQNKTILHYNLQKDGPKDILTAQKQKYYNNTNNFNNENVHSKTGKQKDIKVSFGKVYRSCCCRADSAFGSSVSGENHPWIQVTTQPCCRGSYTCACKMSLFGCSKGEPQHPHAWLDPAEAASLWGQPGTRRAIFPTSLFFKGSFLITPTPPPHFHTLLAFKANISPSPFGMVLPPAFRRPLYQARSRRARQTLPQGCCESGLGV